MDLLSESILRTPRRITGNCVVKFTFHSSDGSTSYPQDLICCQLPGFVSVAVKERKNGFWKYKGKTRIWQGLQMLSYRTLSICLTLFNELALLFKT